MTAIVLTATVAIGVMIALALNGRGDTRIPATTPVSAVQHAERILARRYARGLLSADEYRRTLEVLRS